MFPLDSNLFCLLSEITLSHCLPMWIPGTYFLLETIENVKEHFQNIDLSALSSDILEPSVHTQVVMSHFFMDTFVYSFSGQLQCSGQISGCDSPVF